MLAEYGLWLGIGGGVLALGLLLVWLVLRTLGDKLKERVKSGANDFWAVVQRRGWLPKEPAFRRDYLDDYPKLKLLEDNHAQIRAECETLLKFKDSLVDIEALGGTYTTGGIHSASWKNFMFKSGEFLEENCRLAPRTTTLLRQIPGLYTAFFSILDPKQYIPPHWGYYKGFLRYHLGVVVPGNNADRSCWIRVNPSDEDAAKRDRALIETSEIYHWKNGEGVIFDDTYLHDAKNESDEVRVILWLDLRRKMPWPLQIVNLISLFFAFRDPSVRRFKTNGTLSASPELIAACGAETKATP
jgi:aspartyl/asparaginyl beta-hydroxylase (cupin superfamily)